jgi:hypothetical protein
MDHLPLPQTPALRHIVVPFYEHESGHYQYKGPWLSYPARNEYGFLSAQTSEKLHQLPQQARSKLAAFVQSWLFFGVLEEFLGVEQECTDWIAVTREGLRAITTAPLCKRLDAWRVKISRLEAGQKLKVRAEIAQMLDHMHHIHANLSETTADLVEAVQVGSGSCHSDLLPAELNLLLDILHNTLSLAYNVVFPDEALPALPYARSRLVRDQFASNGWCRSEVSRLYQECSVVSAYFSSRLGISGPANLHSNCSHWVCEAWQVDHTRYRTQHVHADCQCDTVGVPTETIAEMIRAGRIPCVKLDRTGRFLELTTSDQGPFISISHVWADGLGNHAGNTLPGCQLRLIQHRVNMVRNPGSNAATLQGNQPFWMDTLCIPVGRGFEAERNSAIAEMVNIYKISSSVLVLNKELNNITVERSPCELSARITRTTWFRRLWTLHEGVLARKTLFQLQDGSIDLLALGPKVQQLGGLTHFDLLLQQAIFGETSQPYSKILSFQSKPLSERITDIWSAVQWRNTSYHEDETICLANMLGLGLSSILAVSRYDAEARIKRMKAFILQQKYFPQYSIFEGENAHLHRSFATTLIGFEWAPPSFVFRTQMAHVRQPGFRLAMADESGLHVSSLVALIPDGGWNVFTQAAKNTTPELGDIHRAFFMTPMEWDYFYAIRWIMANGRWPLLESVLQDTFPAIILEENLTAVTEESRARVGQSPCKPRMFDDDLISEEVREAVLREMEAEERGETVEEDHTPYDDSRIFSASTWAVIVAARPMTMTTAAAAAGEDSSPDTEVEYIARIIQRVQVDKEMFSTYTRRAAAQVEGHDGTTFDICPCEIWSGRVKWCIQ